MRLLVLLILTLSLAAASPGQRLAQADTGGTGGTTGESTGLAATDFIWEFFREPGPDDDGEWQKVGETELDYFFNKARCECNTSLRIRLTLVATARAKVTQASNATIQLGTGENLNCTCQGGGSCDLNKCVKLGNEQPLGLLAKGGAGVTFEASVSTLYQAAVSNTEEACAKREKIQIYVLADSEDQGPFPDLPVPSRELQLDGQAPPSPTGLQLNGGNDALNVSWDALTPTDVADLQGYAVFCARGGQLPPFADVYRATHSSQANTCPATTTAPATAQALFDNGTGGSGGSGGADAGAGGSDGGGDGSGDSGGDARDSDGSGGRDLAPIAIGQNLFVAPPQLRALDPQFLCAGFLTNSSGVRIRQLENGVPYAVGVSAVDKHGNASAIEAVALATPIPTRDFYRDYRSNGGADDGGFCMVKPGRGGQPGGTMVLLTGLVLALVLARAGRRR